jgi:hypothetical protein
MLYEELQSDNGVVDDDVYQRTSSSAAPAPSSPSSAAPSSSSSTNEFSLKSTFLYLFPFLHTTQASVFFIYKFLYLFNYTKHYTPLLHMLNQIVRRVTLADVSNERSAAESSSSQKTSELKTTIIRYLRNAVAAAVVISTVTAIAQNMRDTYRQRLTRGRGAAEDGDENGDIDADHDDGSANRRHIPPPPETLLGKLPGPTQARLAANSHLCPLCLSPRINPTAAPSGFVFCYRCILLHVRNEGQCPITKMPASESDIVRLYESNGGGGGGGGA